MVGSGELLGPLVLALWTFSVVDVLTSREDDVRHLPRSLWLVLVTLLPFVGVPVWLAVGRPAGDLGHRTDPRPGHRPAPSTVSGAASGTASGTASGADGPVALEAPPGEEFLRRCRDRAEEQRRRFREGPGGGAAGTR